jgi:putative peptide zinc metalloprotease protein
MGIMLLVLMPVPYVDATSSWAFRSKWRRAMVAAAGMYVELAVAAIAAVVWARTADQTVAHEIARNAMVVASVSTLLFNANPLLRFDGYYILSDILEIANLAGRSKQYLYYLVRRYIYGVPRVQSPAHSPGERGWLLVYAVTSTIYRVIISIGILFMLVTYLPDELLAVSLLLVLLSLVMWVLVPAGKFVKYLATSPELERTRVRAQAISVLVIGSIVAALGLIPAPDRDRAEGVVEPANMAVVHMPVDGVVRSVLDTASRVDPSGEPLLLAENRLLEAERRELEAELDALRIKREQARAEDPAVVEALTGRIAATTQRIERLAQRIDRLRVAAPLAGVWVSDDTKDVTGVYLRQGERIGIVADTSDLLIRIAADQAIGPRIREGIGVGGRVELRIKGEPDIASYGVITQLLQTGRSELPSEALGYHAGGTIAIASDAERGTQTAERFFEVIARPDDPSRLMIGQVVVVRFTMPDRPLLEQWYRTARQLVQRRFAL